MTLVKVDSEEQKITNFASKEARKNRNVRFSEPKLLIGEVPANEILPEGENNVFSSNVGFLSYPTKPGSNQGLRSHRSPQENLEAAMIMDSTSQKKQGGSGFLPRISSSEGPFVQDHTITSN